MGAQYRLTKTDTLGEEQFQALSNYGLQKLLYVKAGILKQR
jgi:hypothetical protein